MLSFQYQKQLYYIFGIFTSFYVDYLNGSESKSKPPVPRQGLPLILKFWVKNATGDKISRCVAYKILYSILNIFKNFFRKYH